MRKSFMISSSVFSLFRDSADSVYFLIRLVYDLAPLLPSPTSLPPDAFD